MKASYEPYWILPLDGDPLPTIGTGFRRVTVWTNPRTMMVHIRGATPEQVAKITMARWMEIAHVKDEPDLTFAALTSALRRYYHTHGDDTCPIQSSK